jgi:UDP-2,4-diacetamido-2,4,6-trideoxy-beta-L-altropyranose hydrolase
MRISNIEDACHNLCLRPANMDDCGQLLEWANDPEVRQASFQSEPITPTEHQTWFAVRLEDEGTLIWVLELGQVTCGMVRLEREEQTATLSYLVSPSHRGQGLAAKMLHLVLNELNGIWPGIQVAAWVRPDNIASICALKRVGFQYEIEAPDRLCFVQIIK